MEDKGFTEAGKSKKKEVNRGAQDELEVLALINPLTYAVDALLLSTYAANNHDFIGLPIDFAVLGTLAVAIYALGLARVPRLTWSGK